MAILESDDGTISVRGELALEDGIARFSRVSCAHGIKGWACGTDEAREFKRDLTLTPLHWISGQARMRGAFPIAMMASDGEIVSLSFAFDALEVGGEMVAVGSATHGLKEQLLGRVLTPPPKPRASTRLDPMAMLVVGAIVGFLIGTLSKVVWP